MTWRYELAFSLSTKAAKGRHLTGLESQTLLKEACCRVIALMRPNIGVAFELISWPPSRLGMLKATLSVRFVGKTIPKPVGQPKDSASSLIGDDDKYLQTNLDELLIELRFASAQTVRRL